MHPSDAQRFRSVLTGIGRVYGQELDSVILDAYWIALSDWDLQSFEAACRQLMASCQFMPRPADFSRLRKSASAASPGESWRQVLEHCKGAYRRGGLDDGGPIDRAVAQLGGYRSIAMHDTDYLWALEKRFSERYQEVSEVESARQALPSYTPEPLRISSGGLRRIGR